MKELIYRIFNPEEYLVKKSNAYFFYENDRLIFRSKHDNCEIDFTDKEDYEDFVATPINKNRPINISIEDLVSIDKFKSSLREERSLKVFRTPIQMTGISEHLKQYDLDICIDLKNISLKFYVGYYYANTPPTFILHSNGNLEYNYSDSVYEYKKYHEKDFDTIKMKIRNMSSILRDRYLGVDCQIMNEALE